MTDGRLGVEALERCLDWALSSGRGWRAPGEIAAARAELAALLADNAALRAALRDCLPFLGGYQCDGMAEGDALTALEGRIDALLAGDVGPGAAGARDETAGVAIEVYRNCYDQLQGVTRRNERLEGAIGAAREAYRAWSDPDECDRMTPMMALGDALDALRAGGAGETEAGT